MSAKGEHRSPRVGDMSPKGEHPSPKVESGAPRVANPWRNTFNVYYTGRPLAIPVCDRGGPLLHCTAGPSELRETCVSAETHFG